MVVTRIKSKSADTETKRIKIGLSMDSLRVERWQKDRDTFKSRAEKLGAEVIVQSADGDARKQNDQVVIAKDGVAAA